MRDDQGDAERLEALQQMLSTLTAQVEALVASTATYQSAITDRLTAYSDRVVELARNVETSDARTDDITARLGALEQALHDGLGAVATAGQVRGLTGDLRAQLTDALGPFDGAAVSAALERIEQEVTSSGQVVAETWGEFAVLRAAVENLDARGEADSATLSTLVDQVRETLLDVASGEVVGALWDEFRAARTTLDAMAARQDDAAADRLGEELAAPRAALAEVAERTATVATSQPEGLDVAEVGDKLDQLRAEIGAGLGGGVADPAMLTAVAADVAFLREELTRGLIVEPSEALTRTVDDLQDEINGVREGLVSIGELRPVVDDLRADIRTRLDDALDRIAELAATTETTEAGEPVERAAPLADTGADVTAVADQLAALRDQIGVEFDGVRQLLDRATEPEPETGQPPVVDIAPVVELLELVRDDIAELPGRIEVPAPVEQPPPPAVDPDTVDLLRQEIEAAGGVADEVMDALRKELIALRRRIAVRAKEDILSDEQLELIAEAVARKLEK